MSSQPKIDFFKGNDWEECTAFIQAIRQAAWTESRLQDPLWMANLASLYFSSRALSWHAKLPLEVRQDWFKLEGALVDRWAPADGADDSHIQPVPAAAPAAAPKPVGGDTNGSVVQGVLKAIPDDGNIAPSYVAFNSEGYARTCSLTKDRGRALRVCLHSRSKPGLLEWTGASTCSWLAIHSPANRPLFGTAPAGWATLTIVSFDKLQSSWDDEGPWQLMGCTVSPQGEIGLAWRDLNNSKEIPLSVFLSSAAVYLVVDPETYARQNSREKKGKLIIEPID